MAIEQIDLELILDNPYQARLTYHRHDILDLALSIKTHGLLQVPPGRRIDGNVELGFGHLRKRAFARLAKEDSEKWGKMPVDIRDLSDEQMAIFGLEENLKRRDITPLELARAVDNYLKSFLEKTEVELAKYLNMTKGNVSNMRRVLRLPEKIIEKIDEGRINFTQGRELIILERLENSEELMLTAVRSIKSEKMNYGKPNTVEGMQQAVHDVARDHCWPLDVEFQGYRYDLLFNTRAAGCLDCEHAIRTHPTKSATAHWCTDAECWERHQEEHREKAAAAAKAQMESDILRQAAESVATEAKVSIPQEISPLLERRIVEVDAELMAEVDASYSGDLIDKGGPLRRPFKFEGKRFINTGGDLKTRECYHLVPIEEYEGETRTYEVPQGREYGEYYESLRDTPEGFYHGMLVHKGTKVLIGPPTSFRLQTTEELDEEVKAARLKQLESLPDDYPCKSCRSMESCSGEFVWSEDNKFACDQHWPQAKPVGGADVGPALKRRGFPVVADNTGVALHVPCDSCAELETCDRTHFHVADDNSGRLVCENKVNLLPAPEEATELPTEIPEGLLQRAREAAGTRAEVLDLNDISTGEGFGRQVKQGYAGLSATLTFIDDPEECLERCTHGFHYAFDSKAKEPTVINICSDTQCLGKKKAAFTRSKNASGQALKKAVTKAVKEAIAQTTTLDRSRIKLILLAQMDGQHCSRYYYDGGKNPETWLWDKISAGTPNNDRTKMKLFKAIDKLSDEELAQLVVEFMFYYLVDHGDIGTYQVKVEDPLQWMGVTMKQGESDEEKGSNPGAVLRSPTPTSG